MEMSKAYDPKALVEALKKEGIEGGLDVAKKVVGVLADFLRSSAQLSTEGLVGKLDDLAIPGINYVEKVVVAKLDELEKQLEPVAPVAETTTSQAPAADGAPSA